MKHLLSLFLTVCLLGNVAAAQSLTGANQTLKLNPRDTTDVLSKKFFKVGLGLETQQLPNLFASIEYFFSPGKERQYFMGFQWNLINSRKSEPGSFNNHNGDLRNELMVTSLDFTQKRFFYSGKNVTPYISLNIGLRGMSQNVYLKYQSSLFGFPFKAEDSIYSNQMSFLSLSFGTGLLIYLSDNISMVTAFDIRTGKSFKTYDGIRSPTTATFTIGLQLGWDGKLRRMRRRNYW